MHTCIAQIMYSVYMCRGEPSLAGKSEDCDAILCHDVYLLCVSREYCHSVSCYAWDTVCIWYVACFEGFSFEL